MNRIESAFQNGKAFIAFITCGDPDLSTTAACVRAAVRGGADLIELGIPFSDPTAEGPVIQAANERALKGGVTTDTIFELVQELRRDVTVPMVFMTYANVVYSYGGLPESSIQPGQSGAKHQTAKPKVSRLYGIERFCDRCVEAGIDGMILPDVPFEEKEEFAPACRQRGLSFISLIAPTSENRVAMIAQEAEGFLYIVSSMGVTGVRREITTDIGAMVKLVRENASIPCAVGFGISTPAQAKRMADLSDGAIVGSAIVRLIAEHGKDAPESVYQYVKSMKEGMGS